MKVVCFTLKTLETIKLSNLSVCFGATGEAAIPGSLRNLWKNGEKRFEPTKTDGGCWEQQGDVTSHPLVCFNLSHPGFAELWG